MENHYTVACIQMDTQNDAQENLCTIERKVREAAAHGARLICLPEAVNYIGDPSTQQPEPLDGPSISLLRKLAAELGVYISGGSIQEEIPSEDRSYNTNCLIDDRGEIASSYRKLHTFDVTLPDGSSIAESDRIKPGERIVTCTTPLGTIGTAICYDIRFPELFRLMALGGAQIIIVPANFTDQTGQAHWEPLLRARAIENGCYIVAIDQVGTKPQFTSHGNSMIIDPWGDIIARGSNDAAEIIYGTIDISRVNEIRAKIPSLQNRRSDVYQLR